MNIIKDRDAIAYTDNYDVVLVGTSPYCLLNTGFQSKIRFKYPFVDEANMSTSYGDRRKLGKRLTIDGEPVISLMYIFTYGKGWYTILDYDALERCLRTAAAEFKGKRVMTTLVGGTKFDGNGDRDKVLSLIKECTMGLDLDVYDYKQMQRHDEINAWKRKIFLIKNTDRKRYAELTKGRNEILKRLYLL